MGKSNEIKTNNSPAYISHTLAELFSQWDIKHYTGIPYNLHGQATVECANELLRLTLLKQKGGNNVPAKNRLHKALFTLNYLQLYFNFPSAFLKHFCKKDNFPKPGV
jgi:hypothetical protein